jgi:hypothetical protein
MQYMFIIIITVTGMILSWEDAGNSFMAAVVETPTVSAAWTRVTEPALQQVSFYYFLPGPV